MDNEGKFILHRHDPPPPYGAIALSREKNVETSKAADIESDSIERNVVRQTTQSVLAPPEQPFVKVRRAL